MGAVAGVVVRRHQVSRPKVVGEHLCFREPLALHGRKKRSRRLDLCVPIDQLEPDDG
ncbi:MAG: hypothetical protein GY822_25460 [Deltaproteobacteria bacterium]|nr:hypothetical protein [Deltaproteobacteria bacterium]